MGECSLTLCGCLGSDVVPHGTEVERVMAVESVGSNASWFELGTSAFTTMGLLGPAALVTRFRRFRGPWKVHCIT